MILVRAKSKNNKLYLLNYPHPIKTLYDPPTNGLDATIIRDNNSTNNLKTANEVRSEHTTMVIKKRRKQKNQLWSLLTSHSALAAIILMLKARTK